MPEITGHIVTPEGLIKGSIEFGATIESLTELTQVDDRIILPGIIDCHIHGGGGGDVMDGVDGIRTLARTHAQYGLTGFLATTVTADDASIERVLEAAKVVMQSRGQSEARCLGVHLEGPYLSEGKLGAQPPLTRCVDAAMVRSWFETGIVRVMTYAPEQDPDGILPSLAQEFDVRLQIGHSGCDYHCVYGLLERGVGVTHLFNAMTGVHHRSPGVAQAALSAAKYSEIICDGVHVTEPSFQLAREHIPQLYSVTDSTSAAGMPDGEYQLGTHRVFKKDEVVCLSDGTLAGSAATAAVTVQTLRRFGLDWREIAAMTSMRPASWIGLQNQGAVALGNVADFVTFRDQTLESVWINGEAVFKL
ncbi:MAG: amidohydrolase family protein [Gammaproteobacteria bacterium]